jgi:hypothetical protein
VLALRKGKDIASNPGSDDESQGEIKIGSESPALKTTAGPSSSGASCTRPSQDGRVIDFDVDQLDLDVFQDDLAELYNNAAHAARTPLRGFTKFPSNEGCNFLKEVASHVKQL